MTEKETSDDGSEDESGEEEEEEEEVAAQKVPPSSAVDVQVGESHDRTTVNLADTASTISVDSCDLRAVPPFTPDEPKPTLVHSDSAHTEDLDIDVPSDITTMTPSDITTMTPSDITSSITTSSVPFEGREIDANLGSFVAIETTATGPATTGEGKGSLSITVGSPGKGPDKLEDIGEAPDKLEDGKEVKDLSSAADDGEGPVTLKVTLKDEGKGNKVADAAESEDESYATDEGESEKTAGKTVSDPLEVVGDPLEVDGDEDVAKLDTEPPSTHIKGPKAQTSTELSDDDSLITENLVALSSGETPPPATAATTTTTTTETTTTTTETTTTGRSGLLTSSDRSDSDTATPLMSDVENQPGVPTTATNNLSTTATNNNLSTTATNNNLSTTTTNSNKPSDSTTTNTLSDLGLDSSMFGAPPTLQDDKEKEEEVEEEEEGDLFTDPRKDSVSSSDNPTAGPSTGRTPLDDTQSTRSSAKSSIFGDDDDDDDDDDLFNPRVTHKVSAFVRNPPPLFDDDDGDVNWI